MKQYWCKDYLHILNNEILWPNYNIITCLIKTLGTRGLVHIITEAA